MKLSHRPKPAPEAVEAICESSEFGGLLLPDVPEHLFRKIAKTGGLALGAGALVLAAYAGIESKLDFLPDLPFFHTPDGPYGSPLDDGNKPPVVTVGGVRQHNAITEEVFDFNCTARIGVSVDVEGEKREELATGKYNKVRRGDFLACADNHQSEHATLETDAVTKKVVKVTIKTDGLMPTQPRIDFIDQANCVELRTSMSDKEIIDAIKKYQAELAKNRKKGKPTECDNGFWLKSTHWGVPGVAVGDDITNVMGTADVATQVAIESDTLLLPPLRTLNNKYVKGLTTIMEDKYPGAEVSVKLNDYEARAKKQLNGMKEELEQNGYIIKWGKDKDGAFLSVKADNAGEVTVRLRSITAAVIDSLKLDEREAAKKAGN